MKKQKENDVARICQWMLLEIIKVSGEKGATVNEIISCVRLLSENAREKSGGGFLFWLGPAVSIEDVLDEMRCWGSKGLVDRATYLGKSKRYFITAEGVEALDITPHASLNDWLERILLLFCLKDEAELVNFIQQALRNSKEH